MWRLKPKCRKHYSAWMTTCRTPVKKEAPNIATKASTATSKTVSSVPTIQPIISRIAAPVILMIKLDRFPRGGRSLLIRFAGLVGFLLTQSRSRRSHEFPYGRDMFIFFQLTGARIEMDQPYAIFSGLVFRNQSRIRAAAEERRPLRKRCYHSISASLRRVSIAVNSSSLNGFFSTGRSE